MRILYLPNEYSQQRQRDVKAKIYPVLMAMEATYYKNQGHAVYWGYPEPLAPSTYDKVIVEPENLPFTQLPAPDRILTKYWEYQENGNFKYLPATYIQAARDCWYAKCNFCAWAKKYPVCETRSVSSVISEIYDCAELGFREIFDDSGTFPVGEWLKEFCKAMVVSGLNKRVVLGCNMRFGAVDLEDYKLMKEAGFRMILWGLESVNQETLDILHKGIEFEAAIVELVLAKEAGLWNHVAVMFGYPWESFEEENRTLDFVRIGLLNGTIKTAQASVYDQGGIGELRAALEYRKKVYKTYLHPRYIWNRIKEIRNWDDVSYLIRSARKVVKK